MGAVSAAILAAIGLEALGLGPQNEPTLGMTIFWCNYYGALLRGMWWWWVPPIAVISVRLHRPVHAISSGLDELANPRLRRARMSDAVLQVQNLSVYYHTRRRAPSRPSTA